VGFLLEFGPGQASDSECQCVFSLPFQASGSECQCVFVASVSVCLWLSLLLAASGLFFFFFLCSFPFVQLALSLFSIKKRFVACFYLLAPTIKVIIMNQDYFITILAITA
jgi:hypothetical protein